MCLSLPLCVSISLSLSMSLSLSLCLSPLAAGLPPCHPEEALYLPTFSQLFDCQYNRSLSLSLSKICLSLSLICLSLSLSLTLYLSPRKASPPYAVPLSSCCWFASLSPSSLVYVPSFIYLVVNKLLSLSLSLSLAERRATRPNGEWGFSTRRHMLGHECPEAVSPERGVVLTDLESSI